MRGAVSHPELTEVHMAVPSSDTRARAHTLTHSHTHSHTHTRSPLGRLPSALEQHRQWLVLSRGCGPRHGCRLSLQIKEPHAPRAVTGPLGACPLASPVAAWRGR